MGLSYGRDGETHKKQFCRGTGRCRPDLRRQELAGSRIGITSPETGVTYHLHLSEAEAQQFAAFVSERV
jgi:hypothetical protein